MLKRIAVRKSTHHHSPVLRTRQPSSTNLPKPERESAEVVRVGPKVYAIRRFDDPSRFYRFLNKEVGVLVVLFVDRAIATEWATRTRFDETPVIELGEVVEIGILELRDTSGSVGFIVKRTPEPSLKDSDCFLWSDIDS